MRYLPFEGQGAISTWRIQFSKQFKSFDYDTISDVVLHLRYTALEGGALFKQNAQRELNDFICIEGQQGLARIFSLLHEFSSEWYRFLNPQSDSTKDQTLTMALTSERFPFLFRDKGITITDIELFVKIKPEFTGDLHTEAVSGGRRCHACPLLLKNIKIEEKGKLILGEDLSKKRRNNTGATS